MTINNQITKLYLSAPMTGRHRNDIIIDFAKYAVQVREAMQYLDLLCNVINPAVSGDIWGFDNSVYGPKDYLTNDIYLLSKCDALVLCDRNWIFSKGCRAEVTFAIACDMPIYMLEEIEVSGSSKPILKEMTSQDIDNQLNYIC